MEQNEQNEFLKLTKKHHASTTQYVRPPIKSEPN